MNRAQCLAILESKDNWIEIFSAATYLRQYFKQNRMKLNSLLNAKSGICKEDCGYCAQSSSNSAETEIYGLLAEDVIFKKALIAAKNGASTFCIATSGTRPNKNELQHLGNVVRKIKSQLKLETCLSLGTVTPEQITYLKACGVDRLNHNLNTAATNYQNITTTHSYQERKQTLESLKKQGVNSCSGFICGLGETNEELVDLAFDLKQLLPFSVPINFLIPIQGTKLANQWELEPLKCLKILMMMRFIFPNTELRASAGREDQLRELQPLAFLIVDSIFLGNYLTAEGAPADQDFKLLDMLNLDWQRS
ncbi:biotin synthase BioB [Enterococcus sp. MMGLQ5-2]|nr:biotin synthase BioB [Enterococcus sp. MMGLQ5-2]MBS7584019.1 biotin synthase BioB [Enterococcus sp. MMGLQ5-1]NPD11880.1 biotin synthase BioB [Enterococcus sp. MMGLQ5-1]NPD37996.1 biotin synthase BioB [Enterococcus sp. MMGLQ5-2]